MSAARSYLLALPFLLLSFAVPAAAAVGDVVVEESEATIEEEDAAFSQSELDQMLAPIALYPDSLLAHILMAATYPLEVVEAARWSRANPGLRGEEAVAAVEDRPWDPSVKSLVAFPQLLAMMDEKLEWTRRLGDAFLAQQTDVMDTVQGLRRRAYAAGSLQPNEHYRVEAQGTHIVVESPRREVVYVPYYDPHVVYGPWWWAAHPPVYWAPWPGYYAHAAAPGFYWSVGIFVGSRIFFGISDWHHRHIKVVHLRHPHHRTFVHKVWRHNPHHRHGVAYRHRIVHKHFAPRDRDFRAHPGFRHDARRDWRSVHHGRLSHRERRLETHGAPPPNGIGRLGMRPDRGAASRPPNLPNYNQPPARERWEGRHYGREWRGEGRRHGEWRVNTPQVRIAPHSRAGAHPDRGARGHASGGRAGGWNDRDGSARGKSAFRARTPNSGNGRAPSASGRGFVRSSAGHRNFGQGRLR